MVGALAVSAAPTDKRARRIVREQRHRGVEQQVTTLRDEGRTWAEVAAATGLASSRVRAIHARHVGASERPDDAAILENLRAFVGEALAAGTATSRRAYNTWDGRVASPATIVTRFGSWGVAVDQARGQSPNPNNAARYA